MRRLLEPGEILPILTSNPSGIDAAIAELSDVQLVTRPEVNEWSPLEILAHLRACADVWGDQRIVRMLSEDEPTIQAVHPMRWIQQTNYYETPFSTSFAAFDEQRRRLLTLIETISPEDWERGATFTGGGAPRRYTVRSEADAIARHERAHIKQLAKRCSLIRQGAE